MSKIQNDLGRSGAAGAAAAANDKVAKGPASSLTQIALAFEAARLHLAHLERKWSELERSQSQIEGVDLRFEKEIDAVLAELSILSSQATDTKAISAFELAIKARIWLVRHIPEHEDELSRLARSLCEDILALAPHAAAGT